ncbi:MAG: hypothetical protein ACTHL7_13210 [Steroidobacteraceae bacterium]
MGSALKMRPGGPRPRYRGALALWFTLAALPATAQITPLTGQNLFNYRPSGAFTGDYLSAEGGAIYTDNATRTTGASATGETILMAGLSGNVSRDGPRLDYHLSSNIVLLKYLGGSYATEPSGYLDGTVILKFVPSFFHWIARESFSEVQINPFTAVTPDNLVNLNVITTGPRFTLRPTLRTSVTLDALYSVVTSSSAAAQFADFDSHRYGGDLKIERAFTETSGLYLKGHYEKTDFKDQTNNNNFSIGEALGGYQLTDGRTVIDLAAGYSQLRIYDVVSTVEGPGGSRETTKTESFNEPIWKADISRVITPSQRVALHASEQFTDAATAFRLGFDQPVPTMALPSFATTDPYKQRAYGLDWRFQAARTTLNVSLEELRQHHLLSSTEDLESKWVNVTLTRLLSPVLIWDIGGSVTRYGQLGTTATSSAQPPGTVQSAKMYGVLTDLRWQVGARLALRFIYTHTSQSGAYQDNQIGVTASWALLGANTSAAPSTPGLSPISPASTRYP